LLPKLEIHYKANYGRAVDEVLKSECSGHFGSLLRMTIVEEPVLAARQLRYACDGAGVSSKLLGEVLIGRTNGEIAAIKAAYQSEFNENLEKRLMSELKGDNEKFFVILLQGIRDEASTFSDVNADVEALYKAGEGKTGTDETEFSRIFLNRGQKHLLNVFNAYATKYQHTMLKVVQKEFSGKTETLMSWVVTSILSPAEHWADMLESSMAGVGTNDNMLSRCVVRIRRAGLMPATKEAYLKKYGKSLDKRIKGETSGDYLKLLLALVELPEKVTPAPVKPAQAPTPAK